MASRENRVQIHTRETPAFRQAMTTTFSSAQMRDRGKLLEEKHKKELEAVERKLEKLRRALSNADKEIFDLKNRGNQLAQSLGFSDIGEAQRAIDVSDHEATFYQAFERVQILEDEVRVERSEKELLQARCQELEEQLAGYRERKSVTCWSFCSLKAMLIMS